MQTCRTSGCDASEVLEFFEEAFDQVACDRFGYRLSVAACDRVGCGCPAGDQVLPVVYAISNDCMRRRRLLEHCRSRGLVWALFDGQALLIDHDA